MVCYVEFPIRIRGFPTQRDPLRTPPGGISGRPAQEPWGLGTSAGSAWALRGIGKAI